MKYIRFIFAIVAVSVFSIFTAIPANARDDARQAQLDSLATKLADRLENNGWAFVPDRFTGMNNVTVEFFSTPGNCVTSVGDAIVISLNFIGAKVSAAAATPHQKGRALAGAAASARYGSGLPDHVSTTGKIIDKKVTIGKKSKSVTLEIKYDIEDSNLNQPSSTSRATLYINTKNLTARMVLTNMSLDGTLEGAISFQ